MVVGTIDLKTGVTAELLGKLRDEGKSVAEIAEQLTEIQGCMVTQSCVTRLIRVFKLPKVDMSNLDDTRRAESKKVSVKRFPNLTNPIRDGEGESTMDKIRKALLGRLEERQGGYWLDGKPARVWDLMRAAGMER